METKLNEKRERLIAYIMKCSGDTRAEAIRFIDKDQSNDTEKSESITELNRFFL